MWTRLNLIDYKEKKQKWEKLPICSETAAGQPPPVTPTPVPRFPRLRLWKIPVPPLPSRFCSQQEKNIYIEDVDSRADEALEYATKLIRYDKLMVQTLSRLTATTTPSQEITKSYQEEENWALEWAEKYRKLANELHSLALAARRMPVEKCDKTSYLGGPQIKLSGELAWGGSRNGLEDYNFNGRRRRRRLRSIHLPDRCECLRWVRRIRPIQQCIRRHVRSDHVDHSRARAHRRHYWHDFHAQRLAMAGLGLRLRRARHRQRQRQRAAVLRDANDDGLERRSRRRATTVASVVGRSEVPTLRSWQCQLLGIPRRHKSRH
jgi:hypothetical protein